MIKLDNQWVKMTGDCSLCWYWWNWWSSLLKLYFHKLRIWMDCECLMPLLTMLLSTWRQSVLLVYETRSTHRNSLSLKQRFQVRQRINSWNHSPLHKKYIWFFNCFLWWFLCWHIHFFFVCFLFSIFLSILLFTFSKTR